MYRVLDGKIAEHFANRDDVGMMRQLGLLPPPPLMDRSASHAVDGRRIPNDMLSDAELEASLRFSAIDRPWRPEWVNQHTESFRPERLLQGHLHRPVL